jgi:hypothetical protein
MPFGQTSNVLSGELMPPSSGPTRIDAPAAMHAATAAAEPLVGRTQTLSLGVNPLGLPPQAQETYAAAPLQVTAGEAPIPLVHQAPAAIDRRAETREAAPQVAQRPNYDTAPIPLAVMARPESVPPNNYGTFGPHTTEASQRKKSARSTMLALVSACAVGALAAVALLVAWKMHHASAATATTAPPATTPQTIATIPPTATATASEAASIAAPAIATEAVPIVTSTATSTSALTATTTIATAAPTHTHTTIAPTQTQTQALVPPTQTQTHTLPPATATMTTATAAPSATHKRVGSGL